MNDDRFLEIEMQLSFHEESIQALNDVIAKQDQLILKMQKQIQFLDARIKKYSSDDDAQSIDDNQPPPHY